MTAVESALSETSVRTELLDVAEQMFAVSGFDGVSLRELTRRAGANLASVNYHFRSKEKLFEEVILRRVRPINDQRLELLRNVLQRAADGKPSLAGVLEAFARPLIDGFSREAREPLHRIMVRLYMESDPLVTPICQREFGPVGRQFREAMAKSRPELTSRAIESGFIFYLGAMVNVLAFSKRRMAMIRTKGPALTDEETLRSLVRFGVAGFDGLKNEAAALPAKVSLKR